MMKKIIIATIFLISFSYVDAFASSARIVGTPRMVKNGNYMDLTFSVNFKGCRGQEVYWGINYSEYPNGPIMRDEEGNALVSYPDYVWNAPGNRAPHNNRLVPGYDDCYYNDYHMRISLARFEPGRKYYMRFFFMMDYLRPKRYEYELVLYDLVDLGNSEWFEFIA